MAEAIKTPESSSGSPEKSDFLGQIFSTMDAMWKGAVLGLMPGAEILYGESKT